MQTSRTGILNHLIFPPSAPKADAEDVTARPGQASTPGAQAAPRATMERTVGQDLRPDGGKPQPGVVYTSAAESIRAEAKVQGVDLDQLPLDALISFGQSRGLFTKITYSKEGVMGGAAVAGVPASPGGGDFVSSAVNVMRDFEEGLTALRGPAGKDNARVWNFFSRSSTLSST